MGWNTFLALASHTAPQASCPSVAPPLPTTQPRAQAQCRTPPLPACASSLSPCVPPAAATWSRPPCSSPTFATLPEDSCSVLSPSPSQCFSTHVSPLVSIAYL